MFLPVRWTNKEGWDFHIKDKELIRERISEINDGKEPNLLELAGMIFKREWMQDDGEGNPPNYQVISDALDAVIQAVESGELKFGFVETKIYLKGIFFIKTLHKQDSAYRERIGGMLTTILVEPTKWLECTTPESKVAFLKRLHQWWYINDERERTKVWIDTVLKYFIGKCETDPAYLQAVDIFLGNLLEHRDSWEVENWYDPANWYPKGRGAIQNKVYGGHG